MIRFNGKVFVNGNPQTPKIVQTLLAMYEQRKSPYRNALEQVIVNKQGANMVVF